MEKLYLEDELFGELLDFVRSDSVTDIDWNGADLWITDIKEGRYCSPIKLDRVFIDQFSIKISNMMNRTFNAYEPILEAETDNLRISIIHEDQTNTGTSLSIRKTPPVKRINRDNMLQQKYCTVAIDNFMQNAVKSHLNIFIAGLPGVGKTEYLKALTTYIPASERVITIEDSLEIRYRSINPGKDCVELKVNKDRMDYSAAIKASLRQNPTWILLSEARGKEVTDLISSMSTGTYCITTGHANDARKIPNRVVKMMGTDNNADQTIDDVYDFVDIGVLIKKDESKVPIRRWIDQVILFSREDNKNIAFPLYQDGVLNTEELPNEIMKKFKDNHINNPFVL